MKIIDITLRIIVGSAAVLTISSCTLEPIRYSSASSSYSTGSGRVNTSIFISTGNPRWGYDPHSRSYYDYVRHSYYDPYLNGYYPRGYRPTIVIGAPHPHGWRPGRSVCPPPRNIRNTNIQNYRQRDLAYRKLNHSWAKKVHVKSNNGNHWGQKKDTQRKPWQTRFNSRDNRNDDRNKYSNSNRSDRNDPRSRSYEPKGRVQNSNRTQINSRLKSTNENNRSSNNRYDRSSNQVKSNTSRKINKPTQRTQPNPTRSKPPTKQIRPIREVKPSNSNTAQDNKTKKSKNIRGY